MTDRLLTIPEYCQIHSVTRGTVRYWALTGRIPAVYTGNAWHVDDRLPPDFAYTPQPREGLKRCGACWQWKDLYEGFTESRRHTEGASGLCAECQSYYERRRRCGDNDPLVMVYKQELVALHEKAHMGEQGLARREEMIRQHAERIAAGGYAGDGEGWGDA